MEERDAKQIVNLYRGVAYPGLNRWYDRIDAEVRAKRRLTNCFGRKIYFMGEIGDDTFRQATAAIPQSTIVDITNQTMPKIMEDDSIEFRPCELRVQVHDALFLDYMSWDWSGMATCIHRIATDYMAPELNYGESFRLKVGVKVGLDWGHLHEIDQDLVEAGGQGLAIALKEANHACRKG
jgi:DNA polymerase I-like protein with 3'-5' exonuclease and polymerase domains